MDISEWVAAISGGACGARGSRALLRERGGVAEGRWAATGGIDGGGIGADHFGRGGSDGGINGSVHGRERPAENLATAGYDRAETRSDHGRRTQRVRQRHSAGWCETRAGEGARR